MKWSMIFAAAAVLQVCQAAHGASAPTPIATNTKVSLGAYPSATLTAQDLARIGADQFILYQLTCDGGALTEVDTAEGHHVLCSQPWRQTRVQSVAVNGTSIVQFQDTPVPLGLSVWGVTMSYLDQVDGAAVGLVETPISTEIYVTAADDFAPAIKAAVKCTTRCAASITTFAVPITKPAAPAPLK